MGARGWTLLISQAKALDSQAHTLLAQAKTANASQSERLTQLAIQCFQESRGVLKHKSVDSLKIYALYKAHLSETPNYKSYLNFCSRNGFEFLKREDYDKFWDKMYEESTT